MLKLCRVTKVKVFFLVLVYIFLILANFNSFQFSAAILEKGRSIEYRKYRTITFVVVLAYHFPSSLIGKKWWNRELTLNCKLKCYVRPMKYPLGVSPSKGNQGTTRTHDLRNRSTVTSNGSSNPEVVGSIPTEVKRIFSLAGVVP